MRRGASACRKSCSLASGASPRAIVTSRVGKALAASLARAIAGELTAVEEAVYQTKNRSSQDPLNFPIRLNNKIAALGGVVASADAKPTDQSYTVFDQLSAALQRQLDRLGTVVKDRIPAFNTAVAALGLPAVIVR